MHRCYVQTGLLLFVCYCWRSKFIAKIFSSPAPSWFAWNVKIIDDFPIFLIVISVLHQTRHILKDFSSCPCPSKFFLHPQHSCCWHFSKNASYASSSASFTFPSILSDLELPELFNFELLLEDLLQWLFVFDDNFEHLSPPFVFFNQECKFLLKLKISSSTSSNPFSTIVDLFFFYILVAFLVFCNN